MADKIINFIGEDNLSSTVEQMVQKINSGNQELINQAKSLIEANEDLIESYEEGLSLAEKFQIVKSRIASEPQQTRRQEDIGFEIEDTRNTTQKSERQEDIGFEIEDTRNTNQYNQLEQESNPTQIERQEIRQTKNIEEENIYISDDNDDEEIIAEVSEKSTISNEKERREDSEKAYNDAINELREQGLYQEWQPQGAIEKPESTQSSTEDPDSLENIKRRAKLIGEELIQDARQYYTESSEVLGYIGEEIKSREQQNKLLSQERMYEIGRETDPEKKKEDLLELRSEMAGENLIIDLLREMINTIDQTAKDEIREDRKNVEELISDNKDRIERLGIEDYEGDGERALIETLQRDILSKEKDEPSKVEEYMKRMFAYQAVSGFVSSTGGAFAAKNEYQGIAQLVPSAIGAVGDAMNYFASAIPILGNVIGGIIKGIGGASAPIIGKALSSAESLESGASLLAQTAPGGWGNYTGMGGGAAMYGYDQAKFLQEASQSARAYGTAQGIEGRTYRAIELEKGLGISRGDISTTERLSSFGGGMTTQEYTNELIKGMKVSGAVTGAQGFEQTALIPEFLNISNQLAKEQLDTLGRVDLGVNARMVTAISGLSDNLKNPDVLRGVVSNIDRGLKTSSTPQMEALQLETLSSLNPTASLLELEMMKEKGVKQEGYLTGLMNRLSEGSLNKDELIRRFSAFSDISLTLSSDIVTGFQGGKWNESEWTKKIEKEKDFGFGGKASDVSNRFEETTAKQTNRFAQAGEKMVDVMDSIVDGMQGVLLKISNMLNNVDQKKAKEDEMKDILSSPKLTDVEKKEANEEYKTLRKTYGDVEASTMVKKAYEDLIRERINNEVYEANKK